jgi:C4-dicarboxylate transporter DctQ subunit
MLMKALDHLEEWLITFLMGAATLIIFAAVVHRYASGWPSRACRTGCSS